MEFIHHHPNWCFFRVKHMDSNIPHLGFVGQVDQPPLKRKSFTSIWVSPTSTDVPKNWCWKMNFFLVTESRFLGLSIVHVRLSKTSYPKFQCPYFHVKTTVAWSVPQSCKQPIPHITSVFIYPPEIPKISICPWFISKNIWGWVKTFYYMLVPYFGEEPSIHHLGYLGWGFNQNDIP